MSGGSSRRFLPELRERAVRMVAEISDQHGSEWAAISEVPAARGWLRRDGAQVGTPGPD
jgi:transposase